MQTGTQRVEAQHPVLAQRKLQQLLTVVIGGQALRFTGLYHPVQALGAQAQAGVGSVQQIQLRQFAAAECCQPLHKPAQQSGVIRCM